MADYNAQDLQSTLIYIKKHFGMKSFNIPGRVPALFSDLAPSLKEDRVMLERMSRLGVLEGFVDMDSADEHEREMFVTKTIVKLTEREYIRAKIAATYVDVLVKVFGWKTVVDIPKEFNNEPLKFDSQRYLKEIKEDVYQLADRAFAKGDYANAKILFERAKVSGNIHAGVRLGQMYWYGQGCNVDYEKAIQLFVVGEEYGNPLANEWLSEAYRRGAGVPKDKEKAEELSNYGQKAILDMCMLSDPDAMYMVGWNYINSPYYATNLQLGYSWYERAAKKGHLNATIKAAVCLIEGTGCTQDIKEGMKNLVSVALATDNAEAHYYLGKLYYFNEFIEQDLGKARSHFLSAANRDNSNAQKYLGDIYYWGKGVEVNYQQARKWYLKAADQGNKNAAKELGYMYYNGIGVDYNADEAYKFFKISADGGDADSQYMMGCFCFEKGKYKNDNAGCTYMIKSAEAGKAKAQTFLAELYAESLFGLPQSDEKFVFWIQKAAEQGYPEAEYAFGKAYAELENPEVLPIDYKKAIYWLQRAANQGYDEALFELAKYYHKGKVVEKNDQIALSYAQKYEERLIELESKGKKLPEPWYNLGRWYDEFDSYTDKAIDCYWKGTRDGSTDALYSAGWETLIGKKDSKYRSMEIVPLLSSIQENAIKSKDYPWSYLLGQYYFIEQDWEKSETWFLEASKKGSINAKCQLAVLYYNNLGRPYDGFKYAQEAHDAGSAHGSYLLGLMYKYGHAVKKDKRKAKEILKIAVARGSQSAAKELNRFFF